MNCELCGKSCDRGTNCFDQSVWMLQAERTVYNPCEQSKYPLESGTFCSRACLIQYLIAREDRKALEVQK